MTPAARAAAAIAALDRILAGEPAEKDFFIGSHCLRGAVAGYEYLPVGVFPTHRAVRLTLRLASLREPVRSIRKPRAIPHPPADKDGDGSSRRLPWTSPLGGHMGA